MHPYCQKYSKSLHSEFSPYFALGVFPTFCTKFAQKLNIQDEKKTFLFLKMSHSFVLFLFFCFFFFATGNESLGYENGANDDFSIISRNMQDKSKSIFDDGNFFFSPQAASSQSIFVDGASGADLPDCGSYPDNPCKSISQAINLSNSSFSTILIR